VVQGRKACYEAAEGIFDDLGSLDKAQDQVVWFHVVEITRMDQ
jgi:hypothetical protein